MTGPEIALAATIIGTATSAVGQLKQASAAQATAKFNSQVSANSATNARATAAENEKRFRRLSSKRMGQLRARGASADLLADSATEEELEALTIRHSGEAQGKAFDAAGIIEKSRGRVAAQSARFGAAGTLLKGSATGKGQYDKLAPNSILRIF